MQTEDKPTNKSHIDLSQGIAEAFFLVHETINIFVIEPLLNDMSSNTQLSIPEYPTAKQG